MERYSQEKRLFESIKRILANLAMLNENDRELIAVTVTEINIFLAMIPVTVGIDFFQLNKSFEKGKITLDEYKEQANKWVLFCERCFEERNDCKNSTDMMLWRLYDFIGALTKEEMICFIKNNFLKLGEVEKVNILKVFEHFDYFWGACDPENDNFEMIEQRVDSLRDNKENIIWLYERLADYRSKNTLLKILYNWIYFDKKYLEEIRETNFEEYFDLDILPKMQDEVFVDIGTWYGDTIKKYVQAYGRGAYRKIYAYDLMPSNVEKAEELLMDIPNVILRNKGVSDKAGSITVKNEKKVTSIATMVTGEYEGEDQAEISVVTLDEDIAEPVTMIKMDIEGAEKEALRGCRRHILEEKPKLLICTYHNHRDIFEIPRMIEDMRSDYKFYMRSTGSMWTPSEYLIYAV